MFWTKFWFKWEVWPQSCQCPLPRPLLSHSCNILTLFYIWVLLNSQAIIDPLTCWANGASRMLSMDKRNWGHAYCSGLCSLAYSILHQISPAKSKVKDKSINNFNMVTAGYSIKRGTLWAQDSVWLYTFCAHQADCCSDLIQIGVIIRCLWRIAIRSN